jgi:putative ABC transport system permease protein
MTLVIGALTIGLILSVLALGIYVSFRIFDFSDITAEGSITLGAAVAAALLVSGVNPLAATAAAFCAGSAAGALTGVLHTKFKINRLLSGILVMTALYPVNFHVMGKSNVPLLSSTTLGNHAEDAARALGMTAGSLRLLGWDVSVRDVSILVGVFGAIVIMGFALDRFFRTHLGTAMRATGDNPQMIRALGVDVSAMLILGLAVANGLVAVSGALLAQYQGFADVQMGIGMLVWGLASVIIGEALVGVRSLGLAIVGTIMGSVLFRLLVAMALRWGLDPNDLKLITAVFVLGALVLPTLLGKLRSRKTQVAHA